MSEQETEVPELREEVARLTAMIEALVAAHNQSSSSNSTQAQNTTTVSLPQISMPASCPYGMPPNFTPEGYHAASSIPIPIMTIPNPVVHTTPPDGEPIYHAHSEGPNL